MRMVGLVGIELPSKNDSRVYEMSAFTWCSGEAAVGGKWTQQSAPEGRRVGKQSSATDNRSDEPVGAANNNLGPMLDTRPCRKPPRRAFCPEAVSLAAVIMVIL